MRRSLALPAVLAALLAMPASAPAVNGTFIAGEAVDGPNPDIQRLGDVDVARDGTGALTYVRRDGGVNHIFVSRLVDGAFQPPERVDAGLGGAGADPVVAASDGGRLAIAFISDGQLFTVVRPAGDQPFTAPSLVAAQASSPAIDMSINGVAYLTFTTSGVSAADVRAARLERRGTTFAVLTDPLDFDAAHDAGTGALRSQVAVAADGTALAVFGEAGNDGRTHVIGRRIFEGRVSQAPQDLTLDALDGHAGGSADSPDVAIEDDSSFAWVVFRQAFDDGAGATKTRAIARRLLGSQFEAPVAVDGQGFPTPDSAIAPRVAISGRGEGYAATGLAASAGAVGAVLKDDVFNPGAVLGGGFGVSPVPVPAVAQNGDGLVAWAQGDGSGAISVHAKPYDDIPESRVPQAPGPDTLLSNPALGQVAPSLGLDAAADRAGDVVVAFAQGGADDRRIAAAVYDRAPGSFTGYTTSRWRKYARPPLTWSPSFELWGPITYRVEIDGKPVATTTNATKVTVPVVIANGVHSWRVVATDRRGQSTATASRYLRVDARKPTVSVKTRRQGRAVGVTVTATDASGTAAKASGIKLVKIDFGDGSRAVLGRRAAHRYGHAGRFTLRVTVTDNAGNAAVVRKQLRVK
jgi:hypothetical protein